MAGGNLTAFKAVGQFTVVEQILHDDTSQFRAIEDVHHLVDAGIHGFNQEFLVQQVLNLKRQVAENHGQGKAFQIACARM